MSNPAKEILVIGLGLIGSSLAKAARNKGLVVHGFDEDKNSLVEALNKNIIDNSFESLLVYGTAYLSDFDLYIHLVLLKHQAQCHVFCRHLLTLKDYIALPIVLAVP